MVRGVYGWQDLLWLSSHSLFFTFSFILKEICQFILFHRGGLKADSSWELQGLGLSQGLGDNCKDCPKKGKFCGFWWFWSLRFQQFRESSKVSGGKWYVFFCASLWQKKVMNEEALAEGTAWIWEIYVLRTFGCLSCSDTDFGNCAFHMFHFYQEEFYLENRCLQKYISYLLLRELHGFRFFEVSSLEFLQSCYADVFHGSVALCGCTVCMFMVILLWEKIKVDQ